MVIYHPPDPELIIKISQRSAGYIDAMESHRHSALYPGTDPKKMESSLKYYCRYVIGCDFDDDLQGLWIHYLTHMDSDRDCHEHDSKSGGWISFRGSIKSTIGQAYTSWQMQRHVLRNNDTYTGEGAGAIDIAIGSYSLKKLGKEWLPSLEVMLDLSREHLDLDWEYETNNTEEVKIGLVEHDGLKKIWRKMTLSRVQVASYRSPIRMMHPDLWLIDDWLDETMGDFKEGERKFKQELLGTRNPETVVILWGTILREDDLLDMLSKGGLGTFTFYGKFHAYREIIDGETYTPDELAKMTPSWVRRPHKFLMQQRKDQGDHIFQVEYLLNPMSDESALISNKYLDEAMKSGENLSWDRRPHPNAIRTVNGNDFQRSPTGDWGVMIGLEQIEPADDLERNPRIRGLSWERYRGRTEDEVVDMIILDYEKYGHDLCGFEDNGFQGLFADRALQQRINFPVFRYNTTGKTYKRKRSKLVDLNRGRMEEAEGIKVVRLNIGLLRSVFQTYDIALPSKTEEDRDITNLIKKELRGWQWDNAKGRYVHKGSTKDTTLALLIALITLNVAESNEVEIDAVEIDAIDGSDDTEDLSDGCPACGMEMVSSNTCVQGHLTIKT